MAASEITSLPQQATRSGASPSGGRALIAGLSILVALLGLMNYISLTNASFRNWTVQQLPQGIAPVSNSVHRKEDSRIAEAAAREAIQAKEIDILQARVAALTVDALSLRNTNAKLIAREKVTSARLDIAEKQRLAGIAAAERLGNRMKVRVRNSVARHVATLPGKVLPAVGATVVVAGTVLELRDLCESMRDVLALNAAVGLPAINDREACGVQVDSVQTVVANATRNVAATYASAMQAAGLAPPPLTATTQRAPSAAPPAARRVQQQGTEIRNER